MLVMVAKIHSTCVQQIQGKTNKYIALKNLKCITHTVTYMYDRKTGKIGTVLVKNAKHCWGEPE